MAEPGERVASGRIEVGVVPLEVSLEGLAMVVTSAVEGMIDARRLQGDAHEIRANSLTGMGKASIGNHLANMYDGQAMQIQARARAKGELLDQVLPMTNGKSWLETIESASSHSQGPPNRRKS